MIGWGIYAIVGVMLAIVIAVIIHEEMADFQRVSFAPILLILLMVFLYSQLGKFLMMTWGN